MNREQIEYALAKQVVEGRSIRLATDYGDITFEANETVKIIHAAQKVLEHKLMMLDFKDDDFEIELNENYHPTLSNAFLMFDGRAVGGIDSNSDGSWRADVDSEWDEESGSDCSLIGNFLTQKEALLALWESRFLAYIG